MAFSGASVGFGPAASVGANTSGAPGVAGATTASYGATSPAASAAAANAGSSSPGARFLANAGNESVLGALLNALGLSGGDRDDLSEAAQIHGRPKAAPVKRRDMARVQALANKVLREGAILPLSEIMRTALDRSPGSLMSVNLSKTVSQTWVYSLVILREDGIYSEITVDAKENRVIEVK